MQNAKDSFYMALRARLTTINPERTILLRGAVRPGILVEEAEAPFSQLPNDVFVLRWLGLGIDMDLGSTMAAEDCARGLLLIAVANISGLTLAQLHQREREMAIRSSVGASRGQPCFFR